MDYDRLYPKAFSLPSTHIRFSSTVEDSVGVAYCMTEADAEFLGKLNGGQDVPGQHGSATAEQCCSEDVFEEVMNFFEETSVRLQPFANVDQAPLLSFEEMERSMDDALSASAQQWSAHVYPYWASKKDSRPLISTIKVRLLDTAAEADDADPYVCFRRREVRQTRKTRGRDAQITEKLKKMRLELEQARQLLILVKDRERLNSEDLSLSRQLFADRGKLKDVKCSKNIVGEKGEDEELLISQKVGFLTLKACAGSKLTPSQPAPKAKPRQSTELQRPHILRLRAGPDRSAPENDLQQLSDVHAETEAQVLQNIQIRKESHKKWNQHWVDRTWRPLTPPLDDADRLAKWAPLLAADASYPSPPPTLPSAEGSLDREDVEMPDAPHVAGREADATAGAEIDKTSVFHIPGAYPASDDEPVASKREPNQACRLRRGRGGRYFLEARRKRPYSLISRGVVSESDSDDEPDDFFRVPENKIFDYRVLLRSRGDQQQQHRGGHAPSTAGSDQAAPVAGGQYR